ncbi:MAG: hypothetical protein AAGF95_17365 [Chloroflexota bacterium]
MITVDVKTFLQTGSLAGVQTGMHRTEVQQCFGEPHGVYRAPANAKIWLYACFECYFEQDILYGIHCDNFSLPSQSKQIRVELWSIEIGVSRLCVEQSLQAEHIPYRVVSPWYGRSYDDGRVFLRLASGVELAFIDEQYNPYREPTGLFVMQLWNFAVLPEQPPQKQINFTIPAPTYEQIRRRSLKKKVKIMSLAGGLVEELAQLLRNPAQRQQLCEYMEVKDAKSVKQLSVTIGETDYDTLASASAAYGWSIPKLCGAWVTEQVSNWHE